MKPSLLILNPMSARALDTIATHFTPTYAPDDARRATAVASHGPAFRAVLTIGSIGLAAAEIDAMPKLELICVLGAGFENVDVAHARARGIVIANGAGTNDDCVADHAMALLLASVRAVPQFDRACRAGVWRTALPVQPNVSRKRLGLVGLGAIGAKIARRAAGFDMPVGYHSRTQRADTAYPWFASVAALAAWCDFLVIAAPGGPATKHLVNAEVLDALGPDGYLVNISRGSVVDEPVLLKVLQEGRIAGAGLDVFAEEPKMSPAFYALDNAVLFPHVGSATHETRIAMGMVQVDNIRALFAGKPLLTPVV